MLSFLFKNRRRRKLLAEPMPPAWRRIVERNVAVYELLSEAEQRRLDDALRIIADERPIVGCKGFVVSEEVKVTIAAQAALLLLGEDGYYFEKLPSVLVYSGPYSRRHSLGSTLPVDEEVEMLGEAWHRGSIILSWPAVLAGGRDPRDGQNLVLHEFAHHLDSLDGEMGGLPPLPSHQAEEQWLVVFSREYDRLCSDVARGQPTVLDPYGATSKAELFAVATEAFFERPLEMRERHEELYQCFFNLLKVDPSRWFENRPQPAESSKVQRPERSRGKKKKRRGEVASPDDLPPLKTADQHFTRGLEYYQTGRFDLAEADFNQTVRQAPDDQEALAYRAESRFYLGHLEAALADAERASRLDPHDPHARRVRGMCRVALGHNEAGLADLTAVLEAAGEDIDSLFYRGIARAELGQLREAIADFSRVIELDPVDAEAWHERSRCYAELGDDAEAQRDAARARELGFVEEGERGREGERETD